MAENLLQPRSPHHTLKHPLCLRFAFLSCIDLTRKQVGLAVGPPTQYGALAILLGAGSQFSHMKENKLLFLHSSDCELSLDRR